MLFCFYCDAPVHSRDAYQYDHFPIPKAAGGTDVVPACTTCHDIKDRARLRDNLAWFASGSRGYSVRREILAWGLIDASELARFKRPSKLKLLHARFKRMPRTVRIAIAKCMAIEAHSSVNRAAA